MDVKVESNDTEFSKIVPEKASYEIIAGGFAFSEGPVWCRDHLLFTELPRNRIVRWCMRSEGVEVTTFRSPCGHTNGMTVDKGGRLIAGEQGMRRITCTELDGSYSVLADRYEGRRINGPNDVVTRSDGSVYFTDPGGGFRASERRPAHAIGTTKELPYQGVYCVAPDGKVTLLADDFPFPNGLAFSPDESVLYIINSRPSHIRAFDVAPDGSISNSRIFIDMGEAETRPDGMKVDQQGNVYFGGPDGLWIINPSGKYLGRILVPRPVNMAWGDSDWKSLYVCSINIVYRLRLNVPGVEVGPAVAK